MGGVLSTAALLLKKTSSKVGDGRVAFGERVSVNLPIYRLPSFAGNVRQSG